MSAPKCSAAARQNGMAIPDAGRQRRSAVPPASRRPESSVCTPAPQQFLRADGVEGQRERGFPHGHEVGRAAFVRPTRLPAQAVVDVLWRPPDGDYHRCYTTSKATVAPTIIAMTVRALDCSSVSDTGRRSAAVGAVSVGRIDGSMDG